MYVHWNILLFVVNSRSVVAQEVSTLLYQIGLLIAVSSIASEMFKRIRLPGIIGAILVGILIGGPGGIGLVTDLNVINVLAVLGAVLILFTTGLEFEASTFWTAGSKAFLLTTSGVIASVIIGYLIGISLGWPTPLAILLGVVIAPSGTSVVATVLSAERKIETKSGSTLMTACIIDDVQGVILLSIALGLINRESLSVIDVFSLGFISSVFILGSIYFGSKIFPAIYIRVEKFVGDEVLIASMLGLGLIFAFVATTVGLAAITGAFIIGAIIPYRKIGEKLANRLLPMKDIFAAVFFTSIGLSINPYDIPNVLPLALLILAAALIARFLGGLVGGMLARFSFRTLLPMVIALAVRAEMSLIIAQEGAGSGIPSSEFLGLAAMIVIGSMVIALPLFSRLIQRID
jgi:CPA2 family monovalent cation:H+ antiporter-2